MMIIIIMIKHGKVYLVKRIIETIILQSFKVFIARCHGGNLEGNSIRNLMKNRDEFFGEMSTCLCEQNNQKLIGNSNDLISNVEIKK